MLTIPQLKALAFVAAAGAGGLHHPAGVIGRAPLRSLHLGALLELGLIVRGQHPPEGSDCKPSNCSLLQLTAKGLAEIAPDAEEREVLHLMSADTPLRIGRLRTEGVKRGNLRALRRLEAKGVVRCVRAQTVGRSRWSEWCPTPAAAKSGVLTRPSVLASS